MTKQEALLSLVHKMHSMNANISLLGEKFGIDLENSAIIGTVEEVGDILLEFILDEVGQTIFFEEVLFGDLSDDEILELLEDYFI